MRKSLLAVAILGAFAPSFAVESNGGGASLLDLDDVLETNIDGVEDAPEFITPAAGSYILTVSEAKPEKYKTTDKESGEEIEKTRIKIIYSVVAVKELSDPEEAPPAAGSLFSEQFMTNPDGLSYFKRQAKNILGEDNIKGATIGAIISELSNGHTFSADVKLKVSKGKASDGSKREYTNVQVRIKPTAAETSETPAT